MPANMPVRVPDCFPLVTVRLGALIAQLVGVFQAGITSLTTIAIMAAVSIAPAIGWLPYIGRLDLRTRSSTKRIIDSRLFDLPLK